MSGGHVNPAVTLGMLVAGRVSVLRAVLYIIFQCLGSIAGTAAIRVNIHTYIHILTMTWLLCFYLFLYDKRISSLFLFLFLDFT